MRVFLVAALATALLVPAAVAQKPSPTPPRPTPPPGGSATPVPTSSDSTQTEEERAMFLTGHVATNDASIRTGSLTLEIGVSKRVPGRGRR